MEESGAREESEKVDLGSWANAVNRLSNAVSVDALVINHTPSAQREF